MTKYWSLESYGIAVLLFFLEGTASRSVGRISTSHWRHQHDRTTDVVAPRLKRGPWFVKNELDNKDDIDHNNTIFDEDSLSEEVIWTFDLLNSKSPYVYMLEHNVARQTLEAAEKKPDADRNKVEKHQNSPNQNPKESASEKTNDNGDKSSESTEHAAAADESVVGVKSHSKKSNAVGDPGDDDSDDDDSDDISDSEWEWEFQEQMEHLELNDLVPSHQVQVEVELLGEGDTKDNRFGTSSSSSTTTTPLVNAGGGVGVKLGSRLKNYRRKKEKARRAVGSSSSSSVDDRETQMIQAWLPHVFLPPTPAACDFLQQNARSVDSSSKLRLDRRTLYGGLLLEWNTLTTWDDPSKTKSTTSTQHSRKFLDTTTSQSLQAVMSLATQPQWRQAYSMSSSSTAQASGGLRFYYKEGETNTAEKAPTLGMQETVAMALAHSLGSGMVIIDDTVLSSVRQQLTQHGFADDALKPAALLQSLLDLSRQGKLSKGKQGGGLVSTCMQRDLASGLDDPFDDRVTSSIDEMVKWEQAGRLGESPKDAANVSSGKLEPLPLLLFVRAQSSTAVLKSKSAVDVLVKECNSSDGINLIALGKGVDANTLTLPQEQSPAPNGHPDSQEAQAQNQFQSGAPWFGFPPQNQNASGQHDPEGSRRFNIFLARTVDANGTPGIMGAVAPPQAGNLFPHMMAMQARERFQQQQQQQGGNANQEQLAQFLQQHMQNSGGLPLPPTQFFNASWSSPLGMDPSNAQTPPPEIIHQTLQQVISDLLDRLAQESDDSGEASSELSPELHQAFAQILRNENLRRGIAENLARAVPALSDPKCQGVMLSVFVPPPFQPMAPGKLPDVVPQEQPKNPNQANNNIVINNSNNNNNNNNLMGNWFQKLLNNQESNDAEEEDDSEEEERRKKNSRQKRVRTLAAAAAVMAANSADQNKEGDKTESKVESNLARLEALCKPIAVKVPSDPVRAKSWEAWITRERGSVLFRHNRKALNEQLASRHLSLQLHTGAHGAGSALRQMLSVRDISQEMADVIRCAVELEARKSQRMHESSLEMNQNEKIQDIDETLSQLLLGNDGGVITSIDDVTTVKIDIKSSSQFLHPSSLETAITMTCRISPSPTGGLFLAGHSASHRNKEEILALAQDKHERALISQVVSPQDIGVTYDMIGGLSDVKELLRQSITYPLKFPHLYSEGIAREAVKGVLLFGPPGTGKTMLAKAVATEGGASFLSVDAASVENKWLGESEKNARAIFTLARRLAPCVIFIDEVDSLLSSREGSSDDSAHGTLTSVKTTIMSEWDGLNSGTNGNGEAGSDRVIVIGSTNRPFDLDEAVLRRFPRRILVDLPNLESRREILEVTLAENRLDPTVNLTDIAERLEGYTGSDIKEVCREAVVQISHEQARLLDLGLFSSRKDVTQGSLQRLRPVTTEDFEKALSKLKRSVSEKGRELARVWEWNDEYGEIKKEKKNYLPQLMNMYL